MTKAEYDHYYKILEPHIGKTEITVHTNPNSVLTFKEIEEYEEEGDECPKALFISSNGKNVTIELNQAIIFLP